MNPEFDPIADVYDHELEHGLRHTGEGKDYFARARVRRLSEELLRLRAEPETIVDYGCGTGGATEHLLALNSRCKVVGIDTSGRSIDVARQLHRSPRVAFELVERHHPSTAADLVFVNGVFHHIPVPDRKGVIQHLCGLLRSGGCVSFWENNPWNLGTRYVMSRVSFDQDAEMVWPAAASRLIRDAGCRIVSRSTLFYFPRMLSCLRPIERLLAPLPFGGQYHLLCRKE